MRILVTGHRGHVGAAVTADLERRGHQAAGFDQADGADLRDFDAVRRAADGPIYTTLAASATCTFNPATGNTVTISVPAGTTSQHVQLSFTANNVQNGAQASEIQVMGT